MVETVTAQGAARLLSETPAHIEIIDVRDPDEYAAGHIPGARLVPLDVLRADPDAALSRDAPLVFVCASGNRSLSAAKLAERFGYAQIYNLDGGTRAWARAGLPIESDARAAA
jgi:rhodanese-related sulfurtransferase